MYRLLSITAATFLVFSAALAQEAPGTPGEGAAPSQEATASSPTTAQPAQYNVVKDDDRMVAAWNRKVDDVVDEDVDGPDGKELGEIEAVLEDANGEIRAVVLEYGGFLGFGAKQVIVTLDQIQPAKRKRFTTTLTEEQLKTLPAWTK